MTPTEDRNCVVIEIAKPYWTALTLYRRASGRDQKLPIAILTNLASHTAGPVQRRAAEIIRKIQHDQRHSPYEV